MRTRTARPPIVMLTASAIAVLAASRVVGAAPAPPPSPATGHAAVIAQANIEFTDGSYQWSVSADALDASAAPSPAADATDTFVAVTDGALVAADAATPIALLAAGEAMFVPGDATTVVVPADGAAASFSRIALTEGGAAGAGDPFTPGPGVRDVNLVRDVLDPGGTLAIAESETAPALVVVVSGGVTVAGDPAGSADVTAGVSDTFAGNLTIVNGGTEPAVVLVAVIGSLVQPAASTRRPPAHPRPAVRRNRGRPTPMATGSATPTKRSSARCRTTPTVTATGSATGTRCTATAPIRCRAAPTSITSTMARRSTAGPIRSMTTPMTTGARTAATTTR